MSEMPSSYETILPPASPYEQAFKLLYAKVTDPARRAFGTGNAITSSGLTLAPLAAKLFDVFPTYPVGWLAIATIAAGVGGCVTRNCNVDVLKKEFADSLLGGNARKNPSNEQDVTISESGDVRWLRTVGYEYALYAASHGTGQRRGLGGFILAGMWGGAKDNGLVGVARIALSAVTSFGTYIAAGISFEGDLIRAAFLEARGYDGSAATTLTFGDHKRKWAANTVLRKRGIRRSYLKEAPALAAIRARLVANQFGTSAPHT